MLAIDFLFVHNLHQAFFVYWVSLPHWLNQNLPCSPSWLRTHGNLPVQLVAGVTELSHTGAQLLHLKHLFYPFPLLLIPRHYFCLDDFIPRPYILFVRMTGIAPILNDTDMRVSQALLFSYPQFGRTIFTPVWGPVNDLQATAAGELTANNLFN